MLLTGCLSGCLVVCGLLSVASSSGLYSYTVTTSPYNTWDSVACSYSGQYIIGGVDGGDVYGSVNNGVSWTYRYYQYPKTGFTYTACNSTGQFVAVVEEDKSVIISNNYGLNFTVSDFPVTNTNGLQLMAMSASGDKMYTLLKQQMYSSADYGVSWLWSANITEIDGSYMEDLVTSSDGSFVAICANVGGVLTSFDYGETFKVVNSSGGWRALAIDQTGQYMLASSAYHLYRSTDYGENFTQLSSPLFNPKYGGGFALASSITGDILVAGVNYGDLCVSYDYGNNWEALLTGSYQWIDVACDSTCLQIAAAQHGGSLYVINSTPPPTSQPSAQPSSQPSCRHGSGSNDDHTGGCSQCTPGSAAALGGTCEECGVGYYSDTYGAEQCSECEYPMSSVFKGSTECNGFSLNANVKKTVVVMVVVVVLVLLCACASVKRFAVIVNLIFPTLDLVSDIAYLMTNNFYSPALFALGVLFVVLPVPLFFYSVYKNNAVMPRMTWRLERVWWLSAGRADDKIYYAKFPCFGGDERFPLLSCIRHDNLLSLSLEGVVWLIAIVSQIITIVGYPFVIVANVLFLFCWVFVGVFLHLTKTLSVGNVWNVWFTLWTGVSDHNTDVDVDTEELNGSLQHEFYFETLPQVLLQLINNILLRDFTPLAIFSLVQSLVMALNGIWRFGYYRYIVNTPVGLRDIPIDMSVRVRLDSCGIDWLLLDGRLEPRSKREEREEGLFRGSSRSRGGGGVGGSSNKSRGRGKRGGRGSGGEEEEESSLEDALINVVGPDERVVGPRAKQHKVTGTGVIAEAVTSFL